MKDRWRGLGVNILGMMLLGGLILTSCKDDDNNNNNNGAIDPNSIATANQVYHWTFDNTPVDRVANKGTVVGSVTYVPGRIGQAYKGAENAYIKWDVDTTDKVAGIKSFTIAAWIKAPKVQGGPPMIFQISGTEFLGSLAFFQENNGPNTSDTLALKAFWTKKNATDQLGHPGWIGHDWKEELAAFVADTWFHVATTYDQATSTAHIYVNGNHVLTVPGPYDDTIRYQSDPGGLNNPNGADPLQDLKLKMLSGVKNYGIIGAWGNRRLGTATDDWMKDYTGLVDELRVYDKAFTKTEVKTLYDAEVAKINQ